MEAQSKRNIIVPSELTHNTPGFNGGNLSLISFDGESMDTDFGKKDRINLFFKNYLSSILDDRLQKFIVPAGKKNFLVFKHNKYIPIPTEHIAFFYVKYESSVIVTFDQQEYSVNYSLEG